MGVRKRRSQSLTADGVLYRDHVPRDGSDGVIGTIDSVTLVTPEPSTLAAGAVGPAVLAIARVRRRTASRKPRLQIAIGPAGTTCQRDRLRFWSEPQAASICCDR
jgi:hypothetical protein